MVGHAVLGTFSRLCILAGRAAPKQLAHPSLRRCKMRVDPFVLFVEPHAPVTSFTPARGGGVCNLVRWVRSEKLTRSNQAKSFLIKIRFPYEVIQEIQSLEPPMSEEFGVIRTNQQRRPLQDLRRTTDLLETLVEEMVGVLIGCSESDLAFVNRLAGAWTGDAVILHSGEGPLLAASQVGPHIIQVQVEPDVSVKIAIPEIARVSFGATPHLPC